MGAEGMLDSRSGTQASMASCNELKSASVSIGSKRLRSACSDEPCASAGVDICVGAEEGATEFTGSQAERTKFAASQLASGCIKDDITGLSSGFSSHHPISQRGDAAIIDSLSDAACAAGCSPAPAAETSKPPYPAEPKCPRCRGRCGDCHTELPYLRALIKHKLSVTDDQVPDILGLADLDVEAIARELLSTSRTLARCRRST